MKKNSLVKMLTAIPLGLGLTMTQANALGLEDSNLLKNVAEKIYLLDSTNQHCPTMDNCTSSYGISDKLNLKSTYVGDFLTITQEEDGKKDIYYSTMNKKFTPEQRNTLNGYLTQLNKAYANK